MLTLHPATRATPKGFRPVIMIRNSAGHMCGSKAASDLYGDRETAQYHALQAAFRACGTIHAHGLSATVAA